MSLEFEKVIYKSYKVMLSVVMERLKIIVISYSLTLAMTWNSDV